MEVDRKDTDSFSLVTACLSVEKSGLCSGSVLQHLQSVITSVTFSFSSSSSYLLTRDRRSDWVMLDLRVSRLSA